MGSWKRKNTLDKNPGKLNEAEGETYIASLLEILVYICTIREQPGAVLRITSKNLKLLETIPENLKILILPVPNRILCQKPGRKQKSPQMVQMQMLLMEI